jgi:hypothetical protein
LGTPDSANLNYAFASGLLLQKNKLDLSILGNQKAKCGVTVAAGHVFRLFPCAKADLA